MNNLLKAFPSLILWLPDVNSWNVSREINNGVTNWAINFKASWNNNNKTIRKSVRGRRGGEGEDELVGGSPMCNKIFSSHRARKRLEIWGEILETWEDVVFIKEKVFFFYAYVSRACGDRESFEIENVTSFHSGIPDSYINVNTQQSRHFWWKWWQIKLAKLSLCVRTNEYCIDQSKDLQL